MNAVLSRRQGLILLGGSCALGLALSLSGVNTNWVNPIVTGVFIVCGLGQLASAGMLAAGIVQPHRIWGWSSAGQALQGIAWLGLGCLFLAERFGVGPIPWFVGMLVVVPLVFGFPIERQAHARR